MRRASFKIDFLKKRSIIGGVTTAKLKKAVDAMTTKERIFVLAYLQHLSRADDPVRQNKLGERMRRMDAGRKITLERTKRLHQALETEGL